MSGKSSQNQPDWFVNSNKYEKSLILPNLPPIIGEKERKSRRDANESIEAAIAKQLSKVSLSRHSAKFPKEPQYRPSFDSPTSSSEELTPDLDSIHLRRSSANRPSARSGSANPPSLLVTHILNKNLEATRANPTLVRQSSTGLSVPDRGLWSSDGGRSKLPPSSGSSSSDNSSSSKLWPLAMENLRSHSKPKKLLPAVEDNLDPGKSARRAPVGLSYGPITSSIEDQMAGRRANHRRSKQTSLNEGLYGNSLQEKDFCEQRPTTLSSRALPSVEVDYYHQILTTHTNELSSDTANHPSDNWMPRNEMGLSTAPKESGDSPRRPRRNKKPLVNQQSEELLLDVDEELGGELMASARISSPKTASIHVGGSPIDVEAAVALKNLLLGGANKNFPDGWIGQSFSFNRTLPFGLVQKKGGPCGALAVVQAFVIKYLLFEGPNSQLRNNNNGLQPSQEVQESALVSALTHILLQASKDGEVTLAVPGLKGHFHGLLGQFKADGVIETLNLRKMVSAKMLHDFIAANINFYSSDGNSSLIAFLCSVMLTRGMAQVRQDMDMSDCPLMGAHGYCSQEMVHLLLLGKAISNTFDGDKVLDETTVLKGIHKRSEIGLLSLFEHYDSIVVGENLKTPSLPIWLVCAESHFTVLFGLAKGLEKVSMAERRPIDLFYYDQLSRIQEAPIKLTLDATGGNYSGLGLRGLRSSGTEMKDEYLISPIELCLKTKWRDAVVDWNGSEPLL